MLQFSTLLFPIDERLFFFLIDFYENFRMAEKPPEWSPSILTVIHNMMRDMISDGFHRNHRRRHLPHHHYSHRRRHRNLQDL